MSQRGTRCPLICRQSARLPGALNSWRGGLTPPFLVGLALTHPPLSFVSGATTASCSPCLHLLLQAAPLSCSHPPPPGLPTIQPPVVSGGWQASAQRVTRSEARSLSRLHRCPQARSSPGHPPRSRRSTGAVLSQDAALPCSKGPQCWAGGRRGHVAPLPQGLGGPCRAAQRAGSCSAPVSGRPAGPTCHLPPCRYWGGCARLTSAGY